MSDLVTLASRNENPEEKGKHCLKLRGRLHQWLPKLSISERVVSTLENLVVAVQTISAELREARKLRADQNLSEQAPHRKTPDFYDVCRQLEHRDILSTLQEKLPYMVESELEELDKVLSLLYEAGEGIGDGLLAISRQWYRSNFSSLDYAAITQLRQGIAAVRLLRITYSHVK
jgi:hypothetical protein